MDIREDIEQYADDADKPILLWLLEKGTTFSDWHAVARCEHLRYGILSHQTHRVWYPTPTGRLKYLHRDELEQLERDHPIRPLSKPHTLGHFVLRICGRVLGICCMDDLESMSEAVRTCTPYASLANLATQATWERLGPDEFDRLHMDWMYDMECGWREMPAESP